MDAVLLAGDLYDKPVPPAEAVRLLDWFLTELSRRELPVFAISGNHDSADRVAFGSALLADSRVYVSPVFTGAPHPIPLQDAHGTVDVYLLPFLKPAHLRRFYPEETNAYVFRESLVLTLLGTLFGMPLGILLHRFVMSEIRIDLVSFHARIEPYSFPIAIAVTVALALLVELCMHRKIRRVNMTESLKSIE